MANKITLLDIKHALQDARFRKTLPDSMEKELLEYNKNRNCPCNTKLYRRIIKEAKQQLKAYFPGREVINEEEEIKKLAENHWIVINCHINELEKKLKKLPPGRKQVEVARYEDQVTAIINEIDVIY
jgi:hypothetical protein